jgi:LuxR family transcriptional activator of conjugal transfer of Ti plasmids
MLMSAPFQIHSLAGGFEMNKWFEHLIEQIRFLTDKTKARDVLQKLVREADFNTFSYVSMQANAHTIISNYQEAWLQRHSDMCYMKIDPVIRGARHRVEAFTWSSTEGHRGSRIERQFFDEAAEFGIRSGISIPVRTGFGQAAILTMASENNEYARSRVFNPTIAASAVGQISSRLNLIPIAPQPHLPVRLKPAELTCLRWSAEGKSAKAIAIIEGTTYSNVIFFMRCAKEALGATTITQAVAIATALGLI